MKTTYELEKIKEVAQLLLETVNSKTVLFYGDMGVGKTTLIQALVSELGGGQVSSPTFSIVNEYTIKKGLVYHFDFYRIKDINEVYDIGIEEYLDSKQWIFIEWPEKIRDILPLVCDISYIKSNKNGTKTIIINPFESKS